MQLSAHQRVVRLATLTAVHRAFHWLHLHQPQMRQWLLEMVRIPAPPFGESERAAWFLERFQALGLTNVHRDEEGNALGEIGPEKAHANSPCVLISAHLDTVFPAGTPTEPLEDRDGPRIYAPGICDNGAGLSALLGIAAALKFARISPPIPILFVANVGEEGEGDLRGMRHLFQRGDYRGRIAAAIALEGSGTGALVTRALGSLRFRVTVTGPGGHSWSDAGTPNPIVLLSRALTAIDSLPMPTDPLTTMNVGHISGGTSVNSIPSSATALVEVRSTEPRALEAAAVAIRGVFDDLVAGYPRLSGSSPKVHVEMIGDRPAAVLEEESVLMEAVLGADRHLNIRTEQRIGSTDANIPLSMGIPALAIGTGGAGGNIHTLQEWYEPVQRETALRRILLVLLAVTQVTAQRGAAVHSVS
jgi:acetylornithine deacetylase/succinyl-diaminopimelate desuccinylase-like protein